MALTRETDSELVKLLGDPVAAQSHTFRAIAGATVEAGEAVYVDSSGYVRPTVATAVATNYVVGVALQDGDAGDNIDIASAGARVLCLSGATSGGIVYTSDTAGEPSHTSGTKTSVIGVALSDTVLLVQPAMVSFA